MASANKMAGSQEKTVASSFLSSRWSKEKSRIRSTLTGISMPGLRQSLSLTSLSSMDRDMSLGSLTQMPSSQHNSALLLQRQQMLEDNKRLHVDLDLPEPEIKAPVIPSKKKKRHKNLITANLTGTRYEVVRQMVEKVGFSMTKDDDPNAYLIWNDSFVSTDRVSELKPYQRLNHFPGMGEISRKDCLARNLAKMQKSFPDEYNFIPHTWILPADYILLQNFAKNIRAQKKMRTFIAKPPNGAQGHGISLYRNAEKIPPNENSVVQEYIDKPLLLDGFKFDLRVYVLVTSCDPLRVFLFNDGLVRLATEKYLPPQENNLNQLYMHLTNYSINKHNDRYEKNTSVDSGSKRSIRYFNDYLRKNDIDVALLWKNIADMIIKTLIVAEPHVLHAYRMCRPGVPPYTESVCFEVLGFDVMIDRKLRPWLIEINRSPSFGTDEKIDFDIKSALLEDSFKLLHIKASDKRRNIAAQKAEAQRRLFRSHKKVEFLNNETEKKKQSNEKKKEELKELLVKVRKAAARENFENRNCGRFRRIFPCDDRARHAKYCHILATSFNLFLSGRGTLLQREIEMNYNNKLGEDDILDMLAEYEGEEQEGTMFVGSTSRTSYRHKPLQSMPESLPQEPTELDEDEEESDVESPPGSPQPYITASRQSIGQPISGAQQSNSQLNGTDAVGASHHGSVSNISRPPSQMSLPGTYRSRSLSRTVVTKPASLTSAVEESLFSSLAKERDEEFTRKTLLALNEMRIKFPGKTDAEADLLLDKLNENWKFHKPRIASYWLVKLDSIKRRKVIDIVRSNVKVVLQRVWRSSNMDSLRLYRIFSRVFNRLLWSHGQGLWSCFSPAAGNSWETIFSRSTEVISEIEMNCCRRIVQLCRDCLLVVYQFAAEAKSNIVSANQQPVEPEDPLTPTHNGISSEYCVQGHQLFIRAGYETIRALEHPHF